MSLYRFLRVYGDIVNQRQRPTDIYDLWKDMQEYDLPDNWFCPQHEKQHDLRKSFDIVQASDLDKTIAIDAVAHFLHQGTSDRLQMLFPGESFTYVKKQLDKWRGYETENPVRATNRGYFAQLMRGEGLEFVEKQEKKVGRTTIEKIQDALNEYKRLFDGGFASKAEILTLHRAYPDNKKYAQEVRKLKLDSEDALPLVIGGPASVETIDKEGHLIPVEVLDEAFTNFMKLHRGRDLNFSHSDVQIGWVLPAYIASNGAVYKSGVDDKQLWVLGEIRDDMVIGERVKKEIEDGNLVSYSIAGSASSMEDVNEGFRSYKKVGGLTMVEITVCLSPDSRVWTKNGFDAGLKNISDIEVGEEVLTHKRRWRKVLSTIQRPFKGEIIRLNTDDGEILITDEHPVYSYDKSIGFGWVEAKEIKVGAYVRSYGEREDGNWECVLPSVDVDGPMKSGVFVPNGKTCMQWTGSFVHSVERVTYEGFVYNLEVEEDNSYTTEACVVHNCERGQNPGAHFEILKSLPNEIILKEEDILNAITATELPSFWVFFDKMNSTVVIKADKRNNLTDALELQLQDTLPRNARIIVSPIVTEAMIPLYAIKAHPLFE